MYFAEESFLSRALPNLAAPAQVKNRCSGRSILKLCTLSNGYGYMIPVQNYKYWKEWQQTWLDFRK